jgi:hypothetical protein
MKEQDPVAYCEQMYPEATAEFKRIQHEMYVTLCKKQMDYGPENITLGKDISSSKNKQMSLLGLWFRMNDKMQRILNLLTKMTKPNNESIQDSWLDLANYSIISIMVSNDKWFKDRENNPQDLL